MESTKIRDSGTAMKLILYKEYLRLREGAEILSKDNFGEKVLRLRDGSILKLFRVKHLISSARLCPYSLRFVRNAQRLLALNIPTVEVVNYFKIPSIKRTAVQYKKLEGETLPHYLNYNAITKEMAHKLGVFVSTLHNKGVYFRSVHLENILVLPDNSFGLIDISDMKIYPHSLRLRKRKGNFNHFTRLKSHFNMLKPESQAFILAYVDHAILSELERGNLKKRLLEYFDVVS
jgi:tRNA A-37 threonylcarbamoyl transferase component Bud32